MDDFTAAAEKFLIAERDVLRSRLAAAEQQAEKLAAALEPFACVVDGIKKKMGPLAEAFPGDSIVNVLFWQCRRAAAALAEYHAASCSAPASSR